MNASGPLLIRCPRQGCRAVIPPGKITCVSCGAVFFGSPDIADFRARFDVPDEWTPIGAIAVGHPDLPADPVPPARASERKSLGELVHRGRW